MRRSFRVVPLLFALAATPARADNAGVTAAPILQVPLGARALGMGGAFTAVATDATALQYNPAGLARLTAHEADVTYIAGAGDATLQHLAYAGPTPFTGISGNGWTSVGASVLLSQNGTIQVNKLNSDGSLSSSGNVSAGGDLVISGGYAERVGTTPIPIRDSSYDIDHYLGVGAEYIRSTLVNSYHAGAAAANVGYLLHAPANGLSFGVSGLNLGGRLRYISASDPLPATARAGVAWQGGVSAEHDVTAALDGDYSIYERVWHVDAGVEYFWLRSYGFRCGYQFNAGDQGGFTIGVGYRWKGRFLIDYAFDLGDTLGNAQRVTLSYRFGAVPPSVRGRQRLPFMESQPEHEEMPNLNQQRPDVDLPSAPRPLPRDTGEGVPGWIY